MDAGLPAVFDPGQKFSDVIHRKFAGSVQFKDFALAEYAIFDDIDMLIARSDEWAFDNNLKVPEALKSRFQVLLNSLLIHICDHD
ncbi:MAG TPA: hypothetical protein VKP61_17170 [Candidatus Acidoferrum sp.]|nr:hypothetical protein [Candidatus Acidoferrum sp.]